jgi:hypothetical protein
LIFNLIGLHIDAVIETDKAVFIFEFKLDASADEALAQIRERGYAEKYAQREVTLIGVAFSTEERSVVDWQVETDNFGG